MHGGAEAQEHHEVHDEPRPHESPWVVTLPLVLLAIPSVVIGYLAVGPMLFGDFFDGHALNVKSSFTIVKIRHALSPVTMQKTNR